MTPERLAEEVRNAKRAIDYAHALAERLSRERDLLAVQLAEEVAHCRSVEELLLDLLGEVWEAAEAKPDDRAPVIEMGPPMHEGSYHLKFRYEGK